MFRSTFTLETNKKRVASGKGMKGSAKTGLKKARGKGDDVPSPSRHNGHICAELVLASLKLGSPNTDAMHESMINMSKSAIRQLREKQQFNLEEFLQGFEEITGCSYEKMLPDDFFDVKASSLGGLRTELRRSKQKFSLT